MGKTDTIYTFRFVPDKDMFYVPWNGNGNKDGNKDGNGNELTLFECLKQNKEAISTGTVPILVDGYCYSQPTTTENLAMAKIRSNRVKSELILHGGLMEKNCTAHNLEPRQHVYNNSRLGRWRHYLLKHRYLTWI